MRHKLGVLILLASLCGASVEALAQERIRVGKAVSVFIFTPIDVGVEAGIFKKHGLDVEIQDFAGDARLNQGLAGGTADIGLGGGTNIGFSAKGVPVKAVAVMSDTLHWLGLTVPYNSSIQTLPDLKGKKIGISNPSALSYFLVKELSRQLGWGSDGLVPVPLGAPQARYAAMKSGQIDAVIDSAEGGYALEKRREARVLMTFDNRLGDFYSNMIYATNDMIEKRPAVLRAFLKGWFETIAYMKDNKSRALPVANRITKLPDDIADRTYDVVMASLSPNGRFKLEPLKKMHASLAELGILDPAEASKVKIEDLYTERFLP